MLSPLIGIIASSGGVAAAASSYESIATSTVGSGGAASITFTSISSNYTHLQIRAIGKPTSAGGQEILFTLNGDTGSNYNSHQLYGSGSSAVANAKGTSANAWLTYWDNAQFGSFVTDILDYKDTNKYTTTRSLGGHDLNGSGFILFRSGLWMNTAAVTSISIFASSGNLAEYSQFALYGIKGE